MTLAEKRTEIDEIDRQIIDLLAVRIKVSREIGDIKKKMSIPLMDQERYDKLLQDRIKQGLEYHIPRDIITKIWNIIHQWSLTVQQKT